MQPDESDLWGPISTSSGDDVGFEDSFSPPISSSENGNDVLGSSYVPLQDSSQYLAGLERKLARVQGRAENQRKAESRRLIDALVGTRAAHVSQMMQNPGVTNEEHEEELAPGYTSATVDPQGALGVVLRRVAPDRVAVAPEELCRLLEADILANIHQALEEMPDTPTTLPTSGHNTQNTPSTHETNVKVSTEGQDKENKVLETSKSPPEQKDPSSDEGEK